MSIKNHFSTTIIFVFLVISSGQSQHSVARQWNELNLEAIRNDFARPTVHARNLFHISVAMYDCWATYDQIADTYFLGKDVHGFRCPFQGIPEVNDLNAAREEAISYAAYRILSHRYQDSPGRIEILFSIDKYMEDLGYDIRITDTTYQSGVPAHLGNYMASKIIEYGLQDGANESGFYENVFYEPSNPPLVMQRSGNPDLQDFNKWQPLSLQLFIDQAGNEIPGDTPDFLSPEWGSVSPFALKESDMTIYERDGFQYKVYHDPGPPVMLSDSIPDESSEAYKWGNTLVSIWGSHLDPDDGMMIDISPTTIGNISSFPTSFAEYQEFYNYLEGGDASKGHNINPITNAPYPENIVPRGDYARVLAEFWADGPDSETPPGHWFTIHNTVTDHPLFERKFEGTGDILDALEWDVKAYLLLGGGMHDCAISAWGIKGWYDYIRPVSAIRGMAELGQCSNPELVNFDIRALPLVEGYIEMVNEGDPLVGDNSEHLGKIKLYSWKGPDYIGDPETDVSGVGWILAENWWPYQRPTFVTPPFAGYVSGHSTFSRAAAEIMTTLTGDAFFPGGVGEFAAEKDKFLVFEDGPSQDIVLQWATYRDASDQTSLSRIWGGIHPPIDDIPGRIIGEKIGKDVFAKASRYFTGLTTATNEIRQSPDDLLSLSPNPVPKGFSLNLEYSGLSQNIRVAILDVNGRKVYEKTVDGIDRESEEIRIPGNLPSGIYIVSVKSGNKIATRKIEVY